MWKLVALFDVSLFTLQFTGIRIYIFFYYREQMHSLLCSTSIYLHCSMPESVNTLVCVFIDSVWAGDRHGTIAQQRRHHGGRTGHRPQWRTESTHQSC